MSKLDRLQSLLSLDQPELDNLKALKLTSTLKLDSAYQSLAQDPELKAQLGHSLKALQELQNQGLKLLFEGQINEPYLHNRRQLGESHSAAKLTPDLYIAALWQTLKDHCQELSAAQWQVLFKACLFDTALISSSTLEGYLSSSAQVSENAIAINKVVQALSATTTSHQAARAALDTVREAFGWAYGSYWVINDSNDALVFSAESGEVSDDFRNITQSSSFARGVGVSGRTWQNQQLLFIEDLGQVKDCVRAPSATKAGVKSGVCFPIIVQGRVVGTMDFFSLHQLTLSKDRQQALKTVGQLVSSAIERILSQERHKDIALNAEALNRVLQVLASSESVDSAAKTTLDTVREAFGWAYGSYWVINDSNDALVFSAESGEVSDDFRNITQSSSFARGVGVSGRTWQNQQLLFIEDLGQVKDCVRAPSATKAGVKSGVCFPIIVQGRVVGTMDFFSLHKLTLSKDRQETLRSVSRLVSAALERIDSRERLSASFQQFSSDLSTMASELKGTTATQSAAAQELATSVSQVSATLSEVRKASADSLQKAELVITQAEESVDTSNAGRQAVEAAVTSMRDIRNQVSEIADRILTLSDQTSQIGEIISSVKEIAAQSKLLALNAAIEAARAGDHGRGFAVVATEIRSLSDQSKEATNQVRDILGEIQGGTNSAVVSAEEGTKKAATGMQLADLSGQNIQTLATAIQKSAESARLIANSARQQSAGIEQVAQAMAAISTASSDTVHGIRQIDNATKQLVQLTESMNKLVSSLKN